VARALKNSFPCVRVFPPVEREGWHFFASDSPIQNRSAAELVAHMPTKAIADMMEWGPAKTPDGQFDLMLSREMTTEQMIALVPATPALQDDRPINEYFLLRTPAAELRSIMKRLLRYGSASGDRTFSGPVLNSSGLAVVSRTERPAGRVSPPSVSAIAAKSKVPTVF
jgi:hypothetical protein